MRPPWTRHAWFHRAYNTPKFSFGDGVETGRWPCPLLSRLDSWDGRNTCLPACLPAGALLLRWLLVVLVVVRAGAGAGR